MCCVSVALHLVILVCVYGTNVQNQLTRCHLRKLAVPSVTFPIAKEPEHGCFRHAQILGQHGSEKYVLLFCKTNIKRPRTLSRNQKPKETS